MFGLKEFKVFCPRCDYAFWTKETDTSLQEAIDRRCPACNRYGLDALEKPAA